MTRLTARELPPRGWGVRPPHRWLAGKETRGAASVKGTWEPGCSAVAGDLPGVRVCVHEAWAQTLGHNDKDKPALKSKSKPRRVATGQPVERCRGSTRLHPRSPSSSARAHQVVPGPSLGGGQIKAKKNCFSALLRCNFEYAAHLHKRRSSHSRAPRRFSPFPVLE